ncbi:Os1348 family NHLP clan protein [Actinophytocola sp.]|jgi:hypothetical protein|uniref:Os1348 family NHLP clan protein n=1 Tax=Actinophytocola sp. TaxID=1872138 RepID=UPI002D7E3BFB|nr:Os1348 family NHLP clan protein [Actinophytocola sp.]HET9142929.1 Os1348 family NHLP clan protein [Actinophytocola sp.]
MPGIEDALERLTTDAAFRAALRTDPRTALAGYTLTADDVSLLARRVGANGNAVEQRTSRAGFFGLFAQVTEDQGVIIRGPSSPDTA